MADWDGTGAPPSKKAAETWMHQQGIASSEIKAALKSYDDYGKYAQHPTPGGALTELGSQARQKLVRHQTEQSNKQKDKAAKATKATATTTKAAPSSGPAKAPPKTTTGSDGFAPIPTGTATGHGLPLLPYDAPADVLTGVQVRDAKTGKLRPPAYHEDSALAPLNWSPEKVAALQSQMVNLGLYGAQKVVLGRKWQNEDQVAFTALLEQANVNGRSWADQLKEWQIRPPDPTQLAIMVGGAKKAPLTVHVTNPLDIQQTAESVSQHLLGHTDTGFVNTSTQGFQAQETAAQTADYNAQTGGGGTVTDAPNPGAYLESKLRREHPLEVDGHQFLNVWDSFLGMLGPGGGHIG